MKVAMLSTSSARQTTSRGILLLVRRSSIATQSDPTPTPTPVSAERCASGTSSPARDLGSAELIERFANCHSVEDLPTELRGNPTVEYVVRMTPEEEARELAAVKAHREAVALYVDDPERILAAIAAHRKGGP
jgi:hypothetical protein